MTEPPPTAHLVRGDIVILAASHNPSIVSPEWVRQHLINDVDPSQFVHTTEFSLWDSPVAQITVDRARFQAVTKDTAPEGLDRLERIAAAYADVLKHVPFKAVGLNWLLVGPKPTIDITINARRVEKQLMGYEVSLGATIIGQATLHRVKLVIEPDTDGSSASFNLNAHFDLKESGEALAAIEQFRPMTASLFEIVRTLLGEESGPP